MPLPPLTGHERVKTRLAGAHASGKLPQALLLAGPRGVGKQRLALWLAQLIHCEAPGSTQEPCGECRSCRLVLSLQHPDVHWFVPLELSKRGGGVDADKQVDLVADALAEEMAARREQPFYGPSAGLASHPVASVRLLLRRLVLTPAMGRKKVFIVGDAERLIPQLGTEVAANALLKALEEPPADSFIIITAADPNALLPTVLSRVVLVRVARIADSDVTAFARSKAWELRTKLNWHNELQLLKGLLASSLHHHRVVPGKRVLIKLGGLWRPRGCSRLGRCRFRRAEPSPTCSIR